MANYAANARTNKFRVKDADALVADIARFGVSVVEQKTPGVTVYGDIELMRRNTQADGSERIMLFANEGWPSFDEDSVASRLDLEEDEALPEGSDSLHMIVSKHLVEGEIAIFVEVGAEKLRYLGGTAVAVNHEGETRRVDLDDIVDLAKEIAPEGASIDHPSY